MMQPGPRLALLVAGGEGALKKAWRTLAVRKESEETSQ